MLDCFRCRDDSAPAAVLDRSVAFWREGPRFEDGIAQEARYLAVILQSARLHGEVHGAGAHVLCRRNAGIHLELIDSVRTHIQRDRTVVTLLIDRLRWHAVQIEIAVVVGSAANDGRPGTWPAPPEPALQTQ